MAGENREDFRQKAARMQHFQAVQCQQGLLAA